MLSGEDLRLGIQKYMDLESLAAAITAGAQAPTVVVLPCTRSTTGDLLADVRAATYRTLEQVRNWSATQDLGFPTRRPDQERGCRAGRT